MNVIETGCYNCGSDKKTLYDTENGFDLMKCAQCGLLYVSPRPSEKEISMSTMTGLHCGAETIDVTGVFDPGKVGHYLKKLHDFFPEGLRDKKLKWLDIGCGHGEFLKALEIFSRGNVIAIGSEPNQYKRESARRNGLTVDFFDLDSHADTYDAVSLLNVFSHLPDPMETLGNWRKLLKKDGELFLETGHSCHLESRDHHKPYYLPDHLSFANQEILESMLGRLGFEIVHVRRYRHTVFPVFSKPGSILNAFVRVIRGHARLNIFFPKEPDRDMYIRARLKSGITTA